MRHADDINPTRTIQREFGCGWVFHRTGKCTVRERYCADRGQMIYERRVSGRTKANPIDERGAGYLRFRIAKHKKSNEAVAVRMKKKALEHAVFAKMISTLFDQGLVPGVSNESLWEKRLRRKSRKTLCRRRKQAVPPGCNIENCPEQIGPRQEMGPCKIDYEAMEHSVFNGERTYIYYAHPYSSWERGSNENTNRIIRCFIPKGCDISKYIRKLIQDIKDRINNDPRKSLFFETTEERLVQELVA